MTQIKLNFYFKILLEKLCLRLGLNQGPSDLYSDVITCIPRKPVIISCRTSLNIPHANMRQFLEMQIRTCGHAVWLELFYFSNQLIYALWSVYVNFSQFQHFSQSSSLNYSCWPLTVHEKYFNYWNKVFPSKILYFLSRLM